MCQSFLIPKSEASSVTECWVKTCKENDHGMTCLIPAHILTNQVMKLLGTESISDLFLSFFQIISANVSTANHQPVSLDDVQLPLKVQFTYSVMWSSTK